MRNRKWLLSVALTIIALFTMVVWLLVRTPSPTATIGYFGNNRFLCVRPGQLICLRFSKPLPTGIDEWYHKLTFKGGITIAKPEYAASCQYWNGFDFFGTNGQLADEKEVTEVLYQIPTGLYGPDPIVYPLPNKTKGMEKFRFMLFIMGDPDLDRLIHRQEPLPPDQKVPSEGNVEVYYKEPSLWQRIKFALHHIAWDI